MRNMGFEKGNFVLIDYVAKVKETGEVFDTTKEDVAKKERLYKEGEIYEPKLIVLGEGWVLKALDDSLTTLELEKPGTIEISPDKAFGPRDPEKVRLVPMRRLVEKGITPQLGARIDFGGKPATIRTMGAGRVQLDFNPPLAGKTLVYEVTVSKILETNEEKISALIHRRVPVVDASKFEFKIKKTEVTVNMPEDAFYLEGIQVAKRGIAMDIQKFFPEIDTVESVETFKRPKPAALPAEAKPAETTAETKPSEAPTETKIEATREEKPQEKQ